MSDTTHEPSRREAIHALDNLTEIAGASEYGTHPAQRLEYLNTATALQSSVFAYITRLEAKAQALVAAGDPEPPYGVVKSVTQYGTVLADESDEHAAWRTRQPLKADLAAVLEGSRE